MIDINFFREWKELYGQACHIYENITSNRFSRASPTNPAIVKAYLRQDPLTFIGLWGGSKESETKEADEADIVSLDHLTDLFLRSALRKIELPEGGKVRTVYDNREPFKIFLIFCDLHHIYVNGALPEESEKYFKTLEPIVEKTLERFGERYSQKLFDEENILDRAWSGIHYKLIRLSEVLDEFLDWTVLSDSDYMLSAAKAEELFENQEFMLRLLQKSKKHSRRIDKYSAEEIARVYAEFEIYFLNILRNYTTKRFGGVDLRQGIFFSFSDPDIQKPIAEVVGVPMLYFHSNCPKHGFNECPWYVDGAKLNK